MTRAQVKKPTPSKQEDVVPDVPPATRSKSAAETLAETNELLDEIDALLEPNAEEFVRGYVQKGGE